MGTSIRLGLLILGATVVAAPARGAPLDRYLPTDAQWVASVNVRALLDSALFKKYGQEPFKLKVQKDKGAQELSRVLGFDPYTDVKRVIVAGQGDPPKFLVIVHGSFDLDKIQPILDTVAKDNPDSLKIDIEKTVRYYEFTLPEQPAPAFAAFLDDDTLVVSNSKDYLFHTIFRSNDKKTIKLEKGLQTLIDRADEKKTFWLAAQIPEKAKKKVAENPQAAGLAQKLKYVAGYVTVTDGIQTDLQLQTTDPRAANELNGLIGTIRPFVSKAIQDNKDIGTIAGPIFDGIKITQFRNTLSFTSKVSASTVDRAAKRLQK